MANEHEGNRNQGKGGGGAQQQNQQPEKRPPASPAEMAKIMGEVSATLAPLYPAEQIRVIKGVAMTNNLDMFGKK